jgi:hypothetical protein
MGVGTLFFYFVAIARSAERSVAIKLDCFVADAPRNDKVI